MSGMISPDGSIVTVDEHIAYALELFELYDWSMIEAGVELGAVDTSGVPIDRHNRNVRLLVLAGCVGFTHNGCTDAGTQKGMDLMNNPHYETMIEILLDVFDRFRP